jgi:Fe-S-cluster-containing dehydrogenase component
MSKWNLIIDVAECHNCHNCVVAAKDEFIANEFPGYTAPHPAHGAGVIRIERRVRGSGHQVDASYLPQLCNHCDDAPCVKAGRGAVKKRDDGVVLFDPVACRGRRDLVDACPYGAVVWNEERQLPQTWFFDAHLLDGGWHEPRCVTVCPTRAIQAARLDDEAMAVRARAEGLRTLQPELGTRPRVYYRHLDRVDRVFIAGSAMALAGSTPECVEGAVVELFRDGQRLARADTDAFGDFRFDGLAPGSGRHELSITHPIHGGSRLSIDLAQSSVVLGDVRLDSR